MLLLISNNFFFGGGGDNIGKNVPVDGKRMRFMKTRGRIIGLVPGWQPQCSLFHFLRLQNVSSASTLVFFPSLRFPSVLRSASPLLAASDAEVLAVGTSGSDPDPHGSA